MADEELKERLDRMEKAIMHIWEIVGAGYGSQQHWPPGRVLIEVNRQRCAQQQYDFAANVRR